MELVALMTSSIKLKRISNRYLISNYSENPGPTEVCLHHSHSVTDFGAERSQGLRARTFLRPLLIPAHIHIQTLRKLSNLSPLTHPETLLLISLGAKVWLLVLDYLITARETFLFPRPHPYLDPRQNFHSFPTYPSRDSVTRLT